MPTVLVALITALIGPLILEFIKIRFFNKKTDILGESIISDEKIDMQIESLMETLKCDRICIAQFHNGGHFFPTMKSIKINLNQIMIYKIKLINLLQKTIIII